MEGGVVMHMWFCVAFGRKMAVKELGINERIVRRLPGNFPNF
jgi:hypothetical protein